ncbi:hypothetical protein [Actinomadura macrotermitis]|uniref:Uncharacterized protein n=1 Tax=Actinomadura macrotermitis TaxID=2585200 RepID=A0A7K0BTU2_9ACTN|nr:hypothetical protein [Actinomadura macrotermitis]MQY04600.1 hypothetical protein [Actinomadura macrotermitis]
MSRNRLFPYPVLGDVCTMQVSEVRLDGVPLTVDMASDRNKMVALHHTERQGWEVARLAVRVHAPLSDLEAGPWQDVTCVAILSERRTNARTVTRLRREPDGSWAGAVLLERSRHLKRADLSAHLVATVEGVQGRMIGATQASWTVDLQASSADQPNTVEIVVVDFADVAYPHLNGYKTDPWMVDATGDEPTVYLNSRFDGLTKLLDSGERAARENLSAQIAADAWTALFNAAVYATDMSEEGRPEWPEGWRGSVMQKLLPDIFPELSPEDGLLELVSRRVDGEGGGELQSALMHAVTRQAAVPRRLGGFIRATNRKEGS